MAGRRFVLIEDLNKNKLIIKQNKYDNIKVMVDGKFALTVDITKHSKILTAIK